MQDLLELIVAERTENHARIVLSPRINANIAEIAGIVRGPYCDFTKTLTADFALNPTSGGSAESLIVEPCYWTPKLPFRYDLRLTLKKTDGSTAEEVTSVGLRRFYCDARNFLLEGKRTVLRGLKVDSPSEHDLRLARQYETALIIAEPLAELCESASRFGVPLIADLRDPSADLNEHLAELAWYPAVVLALVSPEQLDTVKESRCFVGVCLGAKSEPLQEKCDAFAIELSGSERPPTWLATCDKPVIAMRLAALSEIKTARAGCDRLQAALAPEFNLAGYFV